ncbi:MAG: phosphatase PAP2 family protein [Bdellovibrionales bacterium]|nr:phosphatase PAP2 family protein [Bdellovibrionales bacterium]
MARTKLNLRTAPKWLGKDWKSSLLVEGLFLGLLIAITLGMHSKRNSWIEPFCSIRREICRQDHINALDRLAIGMKSDRADASSFTTQNWSGYLAYGVPALYLGYRVAGALIAPHVALMQFSMHAVLSLQATFLNQATNEVVKVVAPRPRPFVFEDLPTHGKLPAHYTSFYSGHTSFTAVAVFSLIFGLLWLGAPRWLWISCSVFGGFLIIATGYFRVVSGRHYPTDTFAGAIAGLIMVGLTYWIHRRGTSLQLFKKK